MDNQDTRKNLAETLAETLPKAALMLDFKSDDSSYMVQHYATPKGTEIKEVKTDIEHLLANPRRTKAVASFASAESFLAYVKRHAQERTVAWCSFDPQTYVLKFTAVIDEHDKESAGWRGHRATFEPDMSAEWKAWKGMDGKPMSQLAFAEWLESHDDDINSVAEGMPSSAAMLKMATEFVANQESTLKSAVRLQSGGVRLTYVDDADGATTAAMDVFSKFALGIPVFHGGAGWGITARLKYSTGQGKVNFRYELVRPDRVHKSAATELIETVRVGLEGVPLLMGACT